MGHLGRSDTSRPAPSRSVGRGKGRGKPSPKGKKEVGRGNSLDHLRPKGLVGFLYMISMDILGFQGWVSCGRFLVAELLLYSYLRYSST